MGIPNPKKELLFDARLQYEIVWIFLIRYLILYTYIIFQAVVESTPPSLRRATAPKLINLEPEAPAAPVGVPAADLPPVLSNIPGIKADLLTEADLLLADPATHTHPLGSHSLLPMHPGE